MAKKATSNKTATKKSKSKQQDKSVDVLDIIETEEAKRKESKKQEAPTPPKNDKPAGTKKAKPIKDTTDQLPKTAKERKIVCKDVGDVSVSRVDIGDVIATSRQVYVDNIHSANPKILQTIYWITIPDTRHVIARVTKDEYDYLLQKKKDITHHVSVVDCATIPTLTYGSWKAHEIKGELPSPAQIEAEDEEFKKNPTNFHNPPVKVELYEAQQEAEKATQEASATKEEDTQDEEEDFDFDFEEDEDEDDTEEEDEFDFSEED